QHDAPGAPAVAGAGQQDHGPQPGQVAVLHASQVEMNIGRTHEFSELLHESRVGVLVDLAVNEQDRRTACPSHPQHPVVVNGSKGDHEISWSTAGTASPTAARRGLSDATPERLDDEHRRYGQPHESGRCRDDLSSMPDAGDDSSHQPPCDALRTTSAETAT